MGISKCKLATSICAVGGIFSWKTGGESGKQLGESGDLGIGLRALGLSGCEYPYHASASL